MDGEDEQQRPGLRERIGRRAWVRSAALVGGGVIAGGLIAGTVTATAAATAADEGMRPHSSTSHEERHHGRGHHGGDGDPSQSQRADEDFEVSSTDEHGD